MPEAIDTAEEAVDAAIDLTRVALGLAMLAAIPPALVILFGPHQAIPLIAGCIAIWMTLGSVISGMFFLMRATFLISKAGKSFDIYDPFIAKLSAWQCGLLSCGIVSSISSLICSAVALHAR